MPCSLFPASEPQHRQCPYIGRYAVTNYLGTDIVCSTRPNSDFEHNDISSLSSPETGRQPGRQSGRQPGRQGTVRRGGVKALNVGCSAEHTMEFHSHCEADTITGQSRHVSAYAAFARRRMKSSQRPIPQF